jgi:(2Fe-2S) ferredoxin
MPRTCDQGVNVLVYPDAVLYGRVTKEDVGLIFEQHLIAGKPVEPLLAPADAWS